MNKPEISIIMPVYNAGPYLKKSVQSILNQTYGNFEFLICDDGSTDNSLKILKEFSRQDERIKLFSQKNLGVVKTLNRLIKNSQGEYIARMDADDLAYPKRIEQQIKYLKQHPKTVIVGTAFDIIDNKGKFIETFHHFNDDFLIRWMLIFSSPFCHSSVIIRKNIFDQTGLYDNKWTTVEDYELWTRISQIGTMANLDEILQHYRANSQGVSQKNWQYQVKQRNKLGEIYADKFLKDNNIKTAISTAEKYLTKKSPQTLCLNLVQKKLLAKICNLTGCYLIRKNQTAKADHFFKIAIRFDHKRIDSLINIFLKYLGKAILITQEKILKKDDGRKTSYKTITNLTCFKKP